MVDTSPMSYNRRRQIVRQVGFPIVALAAATSGIVVASTFSAGSAKADDALMMGGTGTPTLSGESMGALISNYIDPATGGSYTGIAVTTPEALPLDPSVQSGLADLQAAMAEQQAASPNEPYLIEGWSQSAVITMLEKQQLEAMEADGQPVPNVTLLLLGSGNRPDGGLFERFPGLYIPGLELSANGAEVTNATDGIATIDIAGQYDFFADFPQYPINLLADLNAVMGLEYVHGAYANGETPMVGPFADQYVEGSSEIVKQVTGDTTFYFIPTQELPLFAPLLAAGVPESVINIVQPATRVIVEAGYDRSIPLGDPTPAELFPSTDPLTFTLEFANGMVQGADNAFELFGAQLPGATDLENLLTSAAAWSAAEIGVPYAQVVSDINAAFDPFTIFTDFEGPIGHDIEDVLMATGIQQLLDPILAAAVSGLGQA